MQMVLGEFQIRNANNSTIVVCMARIWNFKNHHQTHLVYQKYSTSIHKFNKRFDSKFSAFSSAPSVWLNEKTIINGNQ